ncbi:2-oxoglutarate dehydrogenase E1 component [Balneicella halophila]|uniref:oxoglutarate dehydrogenase (succinyl-transferring) n=1 Tax=Balneicella halophila TaxID=1537566 RepID=A0A7L4UMW0_BALHA|nr:2-oxoglutarate dehydrogenase E1 component [Balneicella halophila]PVX49961.1 2-oxoglutarate dehydrogenase E1 component [Balneicella halophila]
MSKKIELGNMDIEAIDALFQQYKKDPESVDDSFQHFFEGFELATKDYAKTVKDTGSTPTSTTSETEVSKEMNVRNLIDGYRRRGHLFTKTNPVRTRRKYFPTLDIENFNLSKSDLDTKFEAGKEIGIGVATLQDIIDHLQETYCKSVGVEYRYMTHPHIITWLQEKMESSKNREEFKVESQKRILQRLVQAAGFENFIHRKFVGQKRFSLEGSETIIPALEAIIRNGAYGEVKDIVIGMAHRGRLNVLSNILQKPYEDIFREFNAESYEEDIQYGDVKYHLGYNNIATFDGHDVTVNLAPNPSHLEAVGPVMEGIAKAQLQNDYTGNENEVLPILIHGDAAIAGQGVVYETIQMSKIIGYKTGGTIHMVINNQVGFTTSYLEARSSTYCTDIAKVTQSPVFHVNGDDAEAMVYVAKLALEFRQKFHIDVFIDILSYRKYGHNEGDEPRFTQPKLYDIISKHKNPRDIYAEILVGRKTISQEEHERNVDDFEKLLDRAYEKSIESNELEIQPFLEEKYENIELPEPEDFEEVAETKVTKDTFLQLADIITSLPEELDFFKKTKKLFEQRTKMIENNKYDWAMGELMAYATLAKENHSVRLSGQDSERGTFSHRHAELMTQDGETKYYPLRHLFEGQPSVRVYNSPLNEYAALGFEYGYSIAHPEGLTIWEAQFGDFHNVGQVIVDQFISSAQEKWGLKSGLVMYLPHGYEGQGAEHSSGRIERFLTLCANYNMQVINPTTPANMFHAIRRQLHRNIRVPLIVFTPKSLLRHPKCTSTIEDFTEGHFNEVIPDREVNNAKEVTKILFCTGKIYYDLLQARDEKEANHIAIVRIEQLYPFPEKQIREAIKTYPPKAKKVWVQEEPLNMGASCFLRRQEVFNGIDAIGREPSGVTAEGLKATHKINQQEIIDEALK